MTFANLLRLLTGVLLRLKIAGVRRQFLFGVDRLILVLKIVFQTLDDAVLVLLEFEKLLLEAFFPHIDLRKALAQECR